MTYTYSENRRNVWNQFVLFLGGMDLEMKYIFRRWQSLGLEYRNNDLGWGAKTSDYGQAAFDEVLAQGKIPVTVELEDDLGLSGAHMIFSDHHGKKRGHEAAALMQIIYLLGLIPTREEILVAANDVGFIGGMFKVGATYEEAMRIRRMEYDAQGISAEELAIAANCVKNHIEQIGNMLVVRCPHSRTAPIADALFMRQYDQRLQMPRQNLLVLSEDKNEINYLTFGYGDRCAALVDMYPKIDGVCKYPSWSGGDGINTKSGNAIWGGNIECGNPNQDDVLDYLTNLEIEDRMAEIEAAKALVEVGINF